MISTVTLIHGDHYFRVQGPPPPYKDRGDLEGPETMDWEWLMLDVNKALSGAGGEGPASFPDDSRVELSRPAGSDDQAFSGSFLVDTKRGDSSDPLSASSHRACVDQQNESACPRSKVSVDIIHHGDSLDAQGALSHDVGVEQHDGSGGQRSNRRSIVVIEGFVLLSHEPLVAKMTRVLFLEGVEEACCRRRIERNPKRSEEECEVGPSVHQLIAAKPVSGVVLERCFEGMLQKACCR